MYGPGGTQRPTLGPGGTQWVIGPDYDPDVAPCNNVGIIGLVEFNALEKLHAISMPADPRQPDIQKLNYHTDKWGQSNF
jgi:hypothetical protein